MGAMDQVIAFVRVIASELSGPSAEPTYSVTSLGGFRLDAAGNVSGVDDDDEAGEGADGQVGYSALGVVSRPLPPDDDGSAEAAALRVDGGLSPIGWRDMRLHRRLNPGGSNGTPAPGQTMFCGYRGAFLSHSLTPDGADNVSTWYVPFEVDGDGVPTKAHAISLDTTPGNESISIVHADGRIVTMTAEGITVAVDDDTFFTMRPGELSLNAERILLKGNVYLGLEAELGVPLLAGPSSPLGPSVFISPT